MRRKKIKNAEPLERVNIKEWTMGGKPLPCHHCQKPLGVDDFETIETPVCPVRVHKTCAPRAKAIRDSIMGAMFGGGWS